MVKKFEDESLEEFGELVPESEVVPMVTMSDPGPEPESKNPKKKKRSFKVKAVAINTWVFQGSTNVSRGLTRVRRGFQMKVVDVEDDWYKVEFKTRDGKMTGYIPKDKVAKI